MVALPRLTAYSAHQLEAARAASSAFSRYEAMTVDASIPELHARRHGAWLECAMAEFFAAAPTRTICARWSATADALLMEAWQRAGLGGHEALLLAVGKLGAGELNLSSDVDLMIMADPGEAATVERGLRKFQTLLQVPGPWGFCFRLDFDLRPGGRLGPVLTSPSQFQDHYWSQGETWERLALVRLRPITGSPALARSIEDLARRFSFRRFLDYTLLDDLKALRSQVHTKGFERRDGELNLKLEIGGIRDIELFVHSLQVLNGGKVAELRTRATDTALDRLASHGLLPNDEAVDLKNIYWLLRHAENLIQSVDDRQTHVYRTSLAGIPGMPAEADLRERMGRVDAIVSELLGLVDLRVPNLPSDESAQKSWLTGLGFSSDTVEQQWPQLIKATALSHKNDRDERARREFLHAFATALSGHSREDRDLGLGLLLDFVRATRGKATFFTMLLRSPRLIDDLARLFCQSPYLGGILASRPELLDHFILHADEPWSPDLQTLLGQMAERKLLTELWAASQYLTDKDLPSLFERITATADSIALQSLAQLREEFSNSNVSVLAMGKWGGRELGLRSDLDLIFVTPNMPTPEDTRVARRFISRLVYDVDLRLRPSGQSGPLIVARDRLLEYWQTDAQAWERQAYSRARAVDGLALDKSLLIGRGLTGEELAELKRIRAKLLRPLRTDEVDIKYAPGGLIDIEFSAQTALLAMKMGVEETSTGGMIKGLVEREPKWRPGGARIHEIYVEIRRFEQMLQLASAHKLGPLHPSRPPFVKAVRLLGLEPDQGWSHLRDLLSESALILDALDPTGLTRS